MTYLVDTNAFWEIIKEWNADPTAPKPLLTLLKDGTKIRFSMPEICTMEIYSVLGKYARGKDRQVISCNKTIEPVTIPPTQCSNKCISAEVKKMPAKEIAAMIKLIKDIIGNQISDFEITTIPLNSAILKEATFLLHKYSVKFDFHSLDATIAATAKILSISNPITVVTYDRVLRNVLRDKGINIFPV